MPALRIRTLYADGSATNARGFGGHAVVDDSGKVLFVGETPEETTAQREEVKAVLAALEQVHVGESAEVWSDSDYTVSMQKRLPAWRARGFRKIGNMDLVLRMEEALARHEGRVTLRWLPGHTNPTHNIADAEARAASRRAARRARPPQAG